MEKLIAVDKLIKIAQKKGIDFGKGNPYNRLRYYTKIGWLPHMVRKKSKEGKTKGHYPVWVIERLLLIESLKSRGLTNEEITQKLTVKNKTQTLNRIVFSKEMKERIILYVLSIGLLFLIGAELGIISIGKPKDEIINVDQLTTQQIIDSGSAFLPYGRNTVFVKNPVVTVTSKVYVSFNDDYSPASRYWVSEIKPAEGFSVTLDTATSKDAGFSWWISN